MPSRNQIDYALERKVALAAAGSSSNTASIDLGAGERAAALESVEIEVAVDDLPAAFASGGTITFTLQDSADNSSFAACAGLGTRVFTGTGAAQTGLSARVKLQPDVRRYVRANVAVSSGAGALTSYYAYLRPRF